MVDERPDLKARAERSAAKREIILEAALEEFLARGFAATRVEDVAQRAGVAKGSIHFHFADKESLFEELVRSVVAPETTQLATLPQNDGSVREMIERNAMQILPELTTGKVGKVLRLLLTEGPRFPRLAEFYFREIVQPGLSNLRRLALLAYERRELQSEDLVRFPELMAAPTSLILVWTSLFGSFARLDVEQLLRAYLRILFRESGDADSPSPDAKDRRSHKPQGRKR